jgi:hypothetical protein
MAIPNPFKPLQSRTGQANTGPIPPATLAATASAQTLNISGSGGFDGNVDFRFENNSAAWAFFTFADTAANLTTATVNNGIGIAPGAVEILELSPETGVLSVILASGTGTFRVTRGMGI